MNILKYTLRKKVFPILKLLINLGKILFIKLLKITFGPMLVENMVASWFDQPFDYLV